VADAQSRVELIVNAAKAINPLRATRKAAAALQKQEEALAKAQRRVTVTTRLLARNLERQTRGIREQTQGVRGLVAAYAGFRTLRGTIGVAVELENAEKRAELLVKRFGQLDGIQRVAAQSARTFRLTQADTLTSLIDLGNRLGPQGASLAEIKDVYEGFNTVLAINKVTAQEAASAQLQLNQALGSGRLAGEEFRAVNEATPQVIDAVAKILRVSRGEVKALAAEGKVSAPVLIQALRNIKKQGAEELEESFNSTAGRLREFQKAQKELSAAIGTELLPAFTPLLKALTSAIQNFLDLPGPVKAFAAGITGVTAALVTLAPALNTTIGLLKALGAAKLIAAGPWVALAAGVSALGVALYQSATAADRFRGEIEKGNKTITEGYEKLQTYQDEIDKLDKRIATAGSNRIKRSLKSRRDAIEKNYDDLLAKIKEVEKKSESAGGGLTGGPTAGDRDKKAKDRLAQLQKQSEEFLFAARNRLTVETQQGELDRVRAEADVQRLEIDRKYAELTKGVTDATVLKNAATARSIELQLVDIQLGRELGQVIDQQADKTSALTKTLGDAAIASLEFAAAKNPVEDLGKAIGITTDSFAQMVANVMQGTQSIADAFRSMSNQIINNLLKMAAQAAAQGLLGLLTSALSPGASVGAALSGKGALSGGVSMGIGGSAAGASYAGATGLTGIGGSLKGLGGFSGFRAGGGRVGAGRGYMVGENGPEYFRPGRSGQIIPNHMIDLGGKFLPFHPLFLAAMSGIGNFGGNRQAFMESFGAQFRGIYGAQPRANGGPVSAGSNYMVGERGPEIFVPRGGGGGNRVQVGAININVQNTGEQLSPAAQKQIANQVQGIVMSTLVNERRSGGVLR
jgi:lambda family phage tail tape measure protein